MQSRRSILYLGFSAATTLGVSPVSGALAWSGTVAAVDEQARTFTCLQGTKTWTYYTTENTRYFVGKAKGSWSDLNVGAVVQVKWHRSQNRRVADEVRISER